MTIEYKLTHEENWKQIWNFKFRKCFYTEQTLWPFTKVWQGIHVNNAGAIVGAPPSKKKVWISNEIHTFKALKDEV
jgi:hypothetical protein